MGRYNISLEKNFKFLYNIKMPDEKNKPNLDYNPPTAHTPPRGPDESRGGRREGWSPSEELKKQLEECQKLKEEYLAGWQRARADLLNYKKEELERIGELINYAGEGFILKILPILDNFEVAEKKLPGNLKNDENVKGILQLKTQILDFLKNQGVEKIKSVGEKFDPNFHEVVEEVEIKDKEPGTIIEEIQKGYKIDGRLLRPAKVKVTK
ncbi:MAG: nucleotide exchange factor GrpE [Candidatus Nealsonbacteria bacterium CG23_combo_of_CG06-09_8_20_14_all_36_12]|uniref:Protein GrpE n=2 Tax=Candidatus Nealsoniibacteriota TaxID=1817911 RepID=A0A2H0TL90_9BACT|nr:MAG: nucleotide exchange factor GrpE [Candidatus Nealsonbacteria bacterium CG23_combo_of_CG06-09_8_20_14_all_36_12]PIR72920.1 MAG: nucleotide exchange factor GrpE [Candidatus Nealsonbacteria bacterium CG10_big_fil_rev_8_21_14_0_10_36_23]